jgi:hypothetical protein
MAAFLLVPTIEDPRCLGIYELASPTKLKFSGASWSFSLRFASKSLFQRDIKQLHCLNILEPFDIQILAGYNTPNRRGFHN